MVRPEIVGPGIATDLGLVALIGCGASRPARRGPPRADRRAAAAAPASHPAMGGPAAPQPRPRQPPGTPAWRRSPTRRTCRPINGCVSTATANIIWTAPPTASAGDISPPSRPSRTGHRHHHRAWRPGRPPLTPRHHAITKALKAARRTSRPLRRPNRRLPPPGPPARRPPTCPSRGRAKTSAARPPRRIGLGPLRRDEAVESGRRRASSADPPATRRPAEQAPIWPGPNRRETPPRSGAAAGPIQRPDRALALIIATAILVSSRSGHGPGRQASQPRHRRALRPPGRNRRAKPPARNE